MKNRIKAKAMRSIAAMHSMAGIIALAVVISLSMAACLSFEPVAGTGTSAATNEAAFAGREVPAKWQKTFEVWRSDDTFVIDATSGTLTVSGSSQSYPNLNVRDGGTVSNGYAPVIGEWAYLYSGDVKIGYIIDEVDWIGGDFDLVIQVTVILGTNSAQEKLTEDRLRAEDPWNMYEGIFNPDTDFSDIPDTVPEWEGDYYLEGHVFG